jgi:hypothetical protein
MRTADDQKRRATRNTIPKTATALGICPGRLKFCAMIHGDAISTPL